MFDVPGKQAYSFGKVCVVNKTPLSPYSTYLYSIGSEEFCKKKTHSFPQLFLPVFPTSIFIIFLTFQFLIAAQMENASVKSEMKSAQKLHTGLRVKVTR